MPTPQRPISRPARVGGGRTIRGGPLQYRFKADFLDPQRTLENYWRAVILFGQNVASSKIALGKSLIELSALVSRPVIPQRREQY